MKNPKFITILFCFCLAYVGCSKESRFPVDKRFWTAEDYRDVVWQISFKTPEGGQYPRFSDPETAIVIKKLTDPQNYEVILDDTELGLNYKDDVSQKFFDEYRELHKTYSVMDIQDKYVYPQELIEIEKFGLGLQIKYFSLGNKKVSEQSDAPEGERTKELLRSNTQTIIRNFTLYFEHINNERYFSSFAPSLADGITIQFFKLIEAFPNGNYDSMLGKAKLMLKKTQVEEIKTALTSLISKLESMKETPKV